MAAQVLVQRPKTKEVSMSLRTSVFGFVMGGLVVCPLAAADVVVELEGGGQSLNNAIASAQGIAAGSFTANFHANVFGNLPTANVRGVGGSGDVDFYGFSTGGGTAYFDVDGTSGGFDTYLALFDATGTLIADNDDSFPGDPGSASDLDAFLGVVNLRAGSYFIAVSSGGNTARASFSGDTFTELTRPDGEFGGFAFGNADFGDSRFDRDGVQGHGAYTLNITIPAPGTALMAGLAGVVTLRRRRR